MIGRVFDARGLGAGGRRCQEYVEMTPEGRRRVGGIATVVLAGAVLVRVLLFLLTRG